MGLSVDGIAKLAFNVFYEGNRRWSEVEEDEEEIWVDVGQAIWTTMAPYNSTPIDYCVGDIADAAADAFDDAGGVSDDAPGGVWEDIAEEAVSKVEWRGRKERESEPASLFDSNEEEEDDDA